ncbi:unnamed protein product [Owenia fusiformis]|uniref:Uncharacterized protein n=1 Tax=Owenia fusiformis TaxID=6347 RepID=A0A8J1Y998_OWEFU|nr:unnamed protein product [Owenia fusiformis]
MAVVLITGSLIVGIFFLIAFLFRWRKIDIPGPKGIPFIGNALQLSKDLPYIQIQEWAKEFGNVFKLQLFREEVVVCNDYETIMMIKSDDFAGRPKSWRFTFAVTGGDKGIVFQDFNESLMLMRKLAVQGLKQYGEASDRMVDISMESIKECIAEFLSHNGEAFNPIAPLDRSITKYIMNLILGDNVDFIEDDFVAVDKLQCGFEHMAQGSGQELDIFPWLRHFGTRSYRVLMEMNKTGSDLFESWIERFRSKSEESNSKNTKRISTLLGVLLTAYDDGVIDMDNVNGALFETIVAGTVTTKSHLDCFILLMLNYPDVQERIIAEIQGAIHADKLPTLADREKLPFTEAVILENFRFMSPVPLCIAHKTTCDTSLGQYKLPKDTEIWTNVWGAQHDPRYFTDPLTFKPERFLDGDGKAYKLADIKSRRNVDIPGPKGIPLLGNALQLSKDIPYIQIQKWAKEFGSVFKLQLFREEVVVCSDYETIMMTKSDDFVGRPKSWRFTFVIPGGDKGIAFQDFNESQKLMRKLAVQGLKQYGEASNRIVDLSMESITECISEFLSHNGEAFNPVTPLDRCITKYALNLSESNSKDSKRITTVLGTLLTACDDGLIDMDNVNSALFETILGGTVTNKSHLDCFILLILNYPDVQERLIAEIQAAIPADKSPTLADREKLPFTEAVILENFRFMSPGPLGVVHKTMCDTSLGRYKIPKDTQLNMTRGTLKVSRKTVRQRERGAEKRDKEENGWRKIDIPGPKGIPLIGNALQLSKDLPYIQIQEWAKEFGNVFKLQLFREEVVVCSDYETIMMTRSDDFAGRPKSWRFLFAIPGGDKGVAFQDFNESHKLMRKLAVQGLKQYGEASDRMVDISIESIEECITEFLSHNGEAFNPITPLDRCITKYILKLILGENVDFIEDDFVAVDKMHRAQQHLAQGFGQELDIFPWLRHFGTKSYRDLMEANKVGSDIFKSWIDSFRSKSEESNLKDTKRISTVLGTLLTAYDDGLIDMDNVNGVLYETIVAGTVTTKAHIDCFILLMLNYPDVQERLISEIQAVIPADKSPTLADREKLPFTEAVILENFRFMSPAPLGFPHKTTCDTSLGQYKIPKDTQVWMNLWTAHHDPHYFTDPLTFKPDRFLDSDGKAYKLADVKALFPFGIGKRSCPGEKIGMDRIFLFVSNMMHKLRFVPVDKDNIPSLDLKTFSVAFTYQSPPFCLKVEPLNKNG